MRVLLVVLLIVASLAGCRQRLEITGAGRGDITSASGRRNCSNEQRVCGYGITGAYRETYTATARAGSVFAGWEGLVCDQAPTQPCTFSVNADFTGNVAGQVSTLRAVFYRAGDPNVTVSIAGEITYDRVPHNTVTNGLNYNGTVAKPVRLVEVEAVNAAGTTLVKTATDVFGRYTLRVPVNTPVRIRALARLSAPNQSTGTVELRDNTNRDALYVAEGALLSSGPQNAIRNLHLPSGWTGQGYTDPRTAAPFAILDTLLRGMNTVARVDPTADFGDLDVFWSPLNTTASGDPETGQIGVSSYFDNQIFVLGDANNDTDEYDQHIIVHEWGHYYEDRFSRADSLGGPHGAFDRLDPRVAFSEGLSTGLAGIVLKDPIYRDASGIAQGDGFEIDIQDNNAAIAGWYSEDSVQAIVFDLFDNDADDEANLGFGPIHQAMVTGVRNTSALTTIFPFMTAIRANEVDSGPAIDSLLAIHEINPDLDDFGSGETNDAGDENVLPIYTLSTGADTASLCVTNRFNRGDDFNKLSNARFLKFDAAQGAGTYRFNVRKTSGDASDPDIFIYEKGLVVGSAVSSRVDMENLVTILDDAIYVVEVYDFLVGDVCFNVSVSQ